jgi:hypothetical protein
VHLIGHDLQRHNPPAVPAGLRADQFPTPAHSSASLHRAAALRAPHHEMPQTADPNSRNPQFPGHAGDNTHRLCQTTRFPAAQTRHPRKVPNGPGRSIRGCCGC